MTDTPIQPPVGQLERWTAALGNLARPFTLYVAGISSAVATVGIVLRGAPLIEGAAYITAAWGGVGVLYGAKALEEGRKAKATAEVEIAKAKSEGG